MSRTKSPILRLAWAMRDAALPPRCMGCDGPALSTGPLRSLCAHCAHGLWPIVSTACERCGFLLPVLPSAERIRCGRCLVRPPAFGSASSAFVHGGPIATAIVRLKHGDMHHAEGLLDLVESHEKTPLIESGTRIVPIPLHPRRCRARGYNQAFLLARALGRRLRCARPLRALARTRDTPIQPGLSPGQRRRNVQGAFHCRRLVKGMRVLLVDDVLTTGATLDAAATALLRAGCVSVDAWTVSRVHAGVP